MPKFAQSAEYAQKNRVKSLPVTHVMVEQSFSFIQGLPDLNARTLHSYRKPNLKLHLPPLLFCFGLNFWKISKNDHFLSSMMNLDNFFYFKLGASFLLSKFFCMTFGSFLMAVIVGS